jgi:hypothetical protein
MPHDITNENLWHPDVRNTDTDQLSSAVHQALGAASTCWESMAGTGVFDDVRARGVADGLLEWIRDNYRNEPQLGLATTGQLLDEIRARLEVSGQINYSTVRHRSAVTGEFVTEQYAEEHPDTTVAESGR